ncbi:21821_t:CDS:2, partial [Gigaspora rosea]
MGMPATLMMIKHLVDMILSQTFENVLKNLVGYSHVTPIYRLAIIIEIAIISGAERWNLSPDN